MKRWILNWIIKSNKRKEIDKINFEKILLETSWQLGDCVINSPFLEGLASKSKNIDIIVRESSMDMLKYYPYIKNIFPYRSHKNKILRYMSRIFFAIKYRNKYDIIISFENEINTFHLFWLKLLNGKYLMSLPKKEKYGIKKEAIEIIDDYFKNNNDILKKLKIKNFSSEYRVYLGPYEELAKNFFDNSKINVIFNYIGSIEKKVLKKEELKSILHSLGDENINIYVSSTPDKYFETFKIINEMENKNIKMLPKTKNIFEIASYVKYSDIIISVDTSLIHIASSYDKKIIGFYMKDSKIIEYAKPNCKNYFIIKSKYEERIEDLNLEEIKSCLKKFVELINDNS
ncbi:glycosyltransferase family 9 protein [Fusobacterium necrogenes]|uniref:glycosyltransferase family 9 protein n=1 Tax=Fusobacterium necrogenes TaxID=858 RepID=UPI00255CBD04|nr:glycosyltransferase family 9 protein [Fusobacterium necrogenes]